MIPICELSLSVAKVFWLLAYPHWCISTSSAWSISFIPTPKQISEYFLDTAISYWSFKAKGIIDCYLTMSVDDTSMDQSPVIPMSKPQSQLLQGIRSWLCFWWNVPRMPLQCSSVAWHCWRISGSWTWAISAVRLGWRTPHPDYQQ